MGMYCTYDGGNEVLNEHNSLFCFIFLKSVIAWSPRLWRKLKQLLRYIPLLLCSILGNMEDKSASYGFIGAVDVCRY